MKFFSQLHVDIALFVALLTALLLELSKIFPKDINQALLLVVTFFATLPVMVSTFRALRTGKITIDLLASVALVMSILAGELLSAVFINLMITSARLFDHFTENKTDAAIKKLMKMRPVSAKVERDGQIITVHLSEVRRQDTVIIDLGERIPVDGIIVKGSATIDQSSFTGESVPVEKHAGDHVLSSTIILSGSLVVKAEKVGKETSFERIIDLVEQSQVNKAAISTLSEKFAKWYILITLIATVVLYAITQNLLVVLGILLVVCADDIAVAIPMTFIAGIGKAASQGIIIKGSSFLEGITRVKTIIVDKTGTLTKGKLTVAEIIIIKEKESEKEILHLAGKLTTASDHPIAKAITEYLQKRKINITAVEDFKESPGMGMAASWQGKKLLLGRVSFIAKAGIKLNDKFSNELKLLENKGYSITIFCVDHEAYAIFALLDQLKPGVKQTIAQLKKSGISRVEMLTGDNRTAAANIAQQAGITSFYSDLLPGDKLTILRKRLKEPGKLAMIGDGVNDAPALTLADIGIAMGAIGSDVSIETADIVLMDDKFSKILELVKIARYVLSVARLNFVIWAVVNIIGLILVLTGVISPAGAAAYNFVTDFIPIINSMRVYLYK